jgi:sugar phosphate isomerase/epimerase
MTALPGWPSAGAPELTLWAGSVMPLTLADRIAAATAGGFAQVSLFPIDVRRAAEAGVPATELRAMFAGAGLGIAAIEPLTRWLPTWSPPEGLAAGDPTLGGFSADEVLAMATALGAGLVNAIAVFDPPVEPGAGARAFADLCDAAQHRGLRVVLEFMPVSGVADLALAWEIVRRAGRPNGGLMVDSWQFARSDSSRELLARVPPEQIFAVQLGDGRAVPVDDISYESLHGRLVPGAGELDMAGLLAAMPAREGRTLGPEVFSDELWRLTPEALGRRLGDATREVLRAARYGGYAS